MRFGMQMYGMNQTFLKDRKAFYERISKAGIRYLELCVMLDVDPAASEQLDPAFKAEAEKHVWTVTQLKTYLKEMEPYGFKVDSLHPFLQNVAEELPLLISQLRAIDQLSDLRQLIVSCPVYQNEEQFRGEAEKLLKAAKAAEEAGYQLLIHNSPAASPNYEKILDICGGKVLAQPDLGWLLAAGIDPETFLWKNEDRIGSIHYKDVRLVTEADGSDIVSYAVGNGPAWTEAVIGTSILDLDPCFQFCRAKELIQIIDQDGPVGDTTDPLGQIEQALGAMKRCCWSHGKSRSKLCILDTETGELKTLRTFDKVIEAPNWHQQNGDLIYFNSEGTIWKYSLSEDKLEQLHFSCKDINNDHVLSPDGTMIALSAENPSQIFIAPIEGGEARQITSMGPSYLHGWSVKDELCYCAFRTLDGKERKSWNDSLAVDVFRISTEGGEEQRLTDQIGYNDGCEYSPDGEYIWYCSTRAGYMQVFRMKRDGSDVTQMTFTEENNWFGHISPDGTKVAYLTFSKDGLDPDEHLPNLYVKIGIMNADGSDPHTVLKFFGGQGSINVNSWSPDNRHLALVVYELIHK